MRWLGLVLFFGVLVGLLVHDLGGTDGKPLSPEAPKHEAVEAAGAREGERLEQVTLVEQRISAGRQAAHFVAERRKARKAQDAAVARKRAQAADRRTTTRTTSQAHTAPSPASSGDIWFDLAMCETGGTMNPRAYNPAGPYYSFFQFGAPDWRRAGGGPGLPWDYSYAEQLRVAQNWQRQLGWGAWPYCSRKLGLR